MGLWTAENPIALNLLKRILVSRTCSLYIYLLFPFKSTTESSNVVVFQPTGLLAYLDSSDPVPEKDVDRMHIRDNVKIATVWTDY